VLIFRSDFADQYTVVDAHQLSWLLILWTASGVAVIASDAVAVAS